jgi:hypothetical protein
MAESSNANTMDSGLKVILNRLLAIRINVGVKSEHLN